MLVALGDVVLLLVSAGLPVLFALLAVVAVTVAGVAAWRMTRRAGGVRENELAAAGPEVTVRS
jgi:hypothetical protein